ncbi:hypothetical protein PMAYCL1PPCAC_19768, partial [Pristionchus mayeri]
ISFSSFLSLLEPSLQIRSIRSTRPLSSRSSVYFRNCDITLSLTLLPLPVVYFRKCDRNVPTRRPPLPHAILANIFESDIGTRPSPFPIPPPHSFVHSSFLLARCSLSFSITMNPCSRSVSVQDSPILYSPDFEQSLMDQFLPHYPSRSEFLSSDEEASSISSPSSFSSPSGEGKVTSSNGNDPVIFYSSDFEQQLMDEFLPNCQSRSEFMAEKDGFAPSCDLDADFIINDSDDSSSCSSSSPSPIISIAQGSKITPPSSPSSSLRLKNGRVHRRSRRGSRRNPKNRSTKKCVVA